MTNKKADEILTAAAQHMRDRAATYDKPDGERSMAQTVAIFNLYHGTALTEAQGWHMMQILKDVRLFARPGYHADSAEDCTAYSALKAEAMACMQESDHAVHAPVVVPTDPEYAPESVALDGGWIEWGGGDCPVLGSTIVEIQLRNGDGDTDKAVKFDWSVGIPGRRMPCGSDIIKYRLSKP